VHFKHYLNRERIKNQILNSKIRVLIHNRIYYRMEKPYATESIYDVKRPNFYPKKIRARTIGAYRSLFKINKRIDSPSEDWRPHGQVAGLYADWERPIFHGKQISIPRYSTNQITIAITGSNHHYESGVRNSAVMALCSAEQFYM